MSAASDDRAQEGNVGDGSSPSPAGRALHWAQVVLCAGGIIAAITIWALGGPPLLAGAVATAAAGGAGWQITVHVRR
ncbi:hypothetical protein ADL00_02395 [Streptomyces sp. AS58]|uniref:hypothetical protein n=1 Tax=Streptomyces sp. AS58 TaxID=1519489 RepID=UPI0006AF560A|nr:hypothetical protein [Streptomyces sp. AS58]KOV74335.1 hypothetical protein ADL00_02395 [Streptomyces sp. AS58]